MFGLETRRCWRTAGEEQPANAPAASNATAKVNDTFTPQIREFLNIKNRFTSICRGRGPFLTTIFDDGLAKLRAGEG